MATGRRDSSPGRLALALPSIWKKVRYRWSPHRMNTVDLGASTNSLSEALIYPWIAQPKPPDGRPRSLSCQLPGPPLPPPVENHLWSFSKLNGVVSSSTSSHVITPLSIRSTMDCSSKTVSGWYGLV
ncbi:uncharacterized protein CDAR_126991 [Caerostris darwini]|uniref:Uncharacterized protein n=1 Tax=Caerostris darwini TaxID=1538125 RepID=A0AAV4RZ24_9ARAC|nr:uncharacterized protein CDAR_126991 [Caerostris darwini]